MRLYRPIFLLKLFFPGALFRVRTEKKELFITFDDGPDPGSTPGILKMLSSHNVKATFFCSGNRAEKYPELMELIKSGGHTIGNHGYYHKDGWLTGLKKYIRNTESASGHTSGLCFRPPYGRIRPLQYIILKKKYRIVFWDIMTFDYDNRMPADRILVMLEKLIRPGSVIVFHDRETSSALKILADFICISSAKGYSFLALPWSGKE